MANVTDCLDRYVREVIALPRVEISSAVKSREWFLKRMLAVIEGRKDEPSLIDEQPYLIYGSYRKGTKVAAVDEFDIMVRIDSNTGVFSRGGAPTAEGRGSSNPNHKYDEKYWLAGQQAVSPTKMLNWLRSVANEVVEPYGGEVPERNGPAITVVIQSKDLRLDLVPGGVFTRLVDGKLFYNIPRGVNSPDWITTAPEEDIARLNYAAGNRENLKSVIRICKRVKDQYNFGVSSFAIETSVVNYAWSNNWFQDFELDFLGTLEALASDLRSSSIRDPFETSTNLLEGVSTDSLTWYANRIATIREGLTAARSITSDERAYQRIRALLENE